MWVAYPLPSLCTCWPIARENNNMCIVSQHYRPTDPMFRPTDRPMLTTKFERFVCVSVASTLVTLLAMSCLVWLHVFQNLT